MINKLITLLLFTLFAACPNAQAMKHFSKVFGKPQSYRGLRAEYIETKKKNAETLTQAANLLTKEEASTSLVLQTKAAQEYNKGIQLMKSQPDTQKIKSIIQDDKEMCKRIYKELRQEFCNDPIVEYGMPALFAASATVEYLHHTIPLFTAASCFTGVIMMGVCACENKYDDFIQRRKKVANYKKEWLHEKIKSIEQGTNSQDKAAEKHS